MKGSIKARSDLLRATASSFCEALLDPPPPAELIAKYFTSVSPRITEHGPEWAQSSLPFLAKTFTGPAGCEEYFSALSRTLKMQMGRDTFPNAQGYIVDSEATVGDSRLKGAVSVVGKATFESIETGKRWHEQFSYRFSGFDVTGNIGHWEIWADPLSAWVAVHGIGRLPPRNLPGASLASTSETVDECNGAEGAALTTRIDMLEDDLVNLMGKSHIITPEIQDRGFKNSDQIYDIKRDIENSKTWIAVTFFFLSLAVVLLGVAVIVNV